MTLSTMCIVYIIKNDGQKMHIFIYDSIKITIACGFNIVFCCM